MTLADLFFLTMQTSYTGTTGLFLLLNADQHRRQEPVVALLKLILELLLSDACLYPQIQCLGFGVLSCSILIEAKDELSVGSVETSCTFRLRYGLFFEPGCIRPFLEQRKRGPEPDERKYYEETVEALTPSPPAFEKDAHLHCWL